MAIQALYPSRRQSRWDNPLFVRAWRRRVIALGAILAIGLIVVIGPHFMPSDAAAQARPTINKAATAMPMTSHSTEPKRKVRIIRLYSTPNDQLTAVPGKA